MEDDLPTEFDLIVVGTGNDINFINCTFPPSYMLPHLHPKQNLPH